MGQISKQGSAVNSSVPGGIDWGHLGTFSWWADWEIQKGFICLSRDCWEVRFNRVLPLHAVSGLLHVSSRWISYMETQDSKDEYLRYRKWKYQSFKTWPQNLSHRIFKAVKGPSQIQTAGLGVGGLQILHKSMTGLPRNLCHFYCVIACLSSDFTEDTFSPSHDSCIFTTASHSGQVPGVNGVPSLWGLDFSLISYELKPRILHFSYNEWCWASFHVFVSHLYVFFGEMSI